MINHQELVIEITHELYKDKNVLALMLYGSVSRHVSIYNYEYNNFRL